MRKNSFIWQVANNQSLASSFNTSPTVINYLDNVAYQINITTTDSIGTFAVQASLDYKVDGPTGTVVNPGNWIPLTLSGAPFANAANDNILIDLNQLPYSAVRIAYTSATPGTGHCTIYLEAKELG